MRSWDARHQPRFPSSDPFSLKQHGVRATHRERQLTQRRTWIESSSRSSEDSQAFAPLAENRHKVQPSQMSSRAIIAQPIQGWPSSSSSRQHLRKTQRAASNQPSLRESAQNTCGNNGEKQHMKSSRWARDGQGEAGSFGGSMKARRPTMRLIHSTFFKYGQKRCESMIMSTDAMHHEPLAALFV